MAKKLKRQQGFQLPEQVISWLNRQERLTGASLSRLALAAFCAYQLWSDDHQREAMQFAMAVEKGEISFDKLRESHCEWVVNRFKADIEAFQRSGNAKAVRDFKDGLREAEGRLEACRQGRYREE